MHVLMEPSELEDLFDIMDEDGTGSVSHEEFFNGLTLALVSNVPIEQLRIFKKLDRCLRTEESVYIMSKQVMQDTQKLLVASGYQPEITARTTRVGRVTRPQTLHLRE